MNKAIVTRADENIKAYTCITHPVIKRYAEKCEADFIVLDGEPKIRTTAGKTYYRILEFIELFKQYDRLLSIDSDVLVTNFAPNIFNVVPKTHIGTIYEDKGSRKKNRRMNIKIIQRQWEEIGWETGYINTGFFLLSREHEDVLNSYKGEYWMDWSADDLHIGFMIKKYDHLVYELGFEWNHMTMFSEDWNNNANRFSSYIIHYAGRGVFDKGVENKTQQIKKDYETRKNMFDVS